MNSKVTYIGSHPAVAIQDTDTRREFICKRGKPVDMPTALAGRLVFQCPNDWEFGVEVENAAATRKVEVEGLRAQAEAERKAREAREQLLDGADDVSTSGQADASASENQ